MVAWVWAWPNLSVSRGSWQSSACARWLDRAECLWRWPDAEATLQQLAAEQAAEGLAGYVGMQVHGTCDSTCGLARARLVGHLGLCCPGRF